MKGNYSVGKAHQQKPNEREKPLNAHEKKKLKEKRKLCLEKKVKEKPQTISQSP
jgi:hypothetical protein